MAPPLIRLERVSKRYAQDFTPLADKFGVFGTPAQCADQIERFRRAGCSYFILSPSCPQEEEREQLEMAGIDASLLDPVEQVCEARRRHVLPPNARHRLDAVETAGEPLSEPSGLGGTRRLRAALPQDAELPGCQQDALRL